MLQADLDSLQSLSDTWLLKFHPNKCKVISVANKCVDKGTKHYYLYDNDGNRIELEQSDGEKDIGVFKNFQNSNLLNVTRNFDQSDTLPEFDLELFIHCGLATCQMTNWMMKADN